MNNLENFDLFRLVGMGVKRMEPEVRALHASFRVKSLAIVQPFCGLIGLTLGEPLLSHPVLVVLALLTQHLTAFYYSFGLERMLLVLFEIF